MASQALKKTCNVLMVVAILTMMFSADIAHSRDVGMCVKHCLYQCSKSAKKPTPTHCEETCKKDCNKQAISKEKVIFPPGEGDGGINKFCQNFPKACNWF
ncbi:hypothetical protein CARUB_v10011697mg [Capsella rubella]|uniref:Plant thionin family protein n=1 Tax=Capsella rubella TaxID=81985 RepID=R0GLC4_9BRAS|nr:hypothetical protein CARUB_v10011697mg [Capsella rubella]